MPKLIRYNIYVLVVVLAINNLIIQVFTKNLGGNSLVALYKDILLIPILIYFLIDIFRLGFKYFSYNNSKIQLVKVFFPLIVLIILHILIFLASFVFNQVSSFGALIFGYYFELWWVVLLALYLNWYNLNKLLNKEFKQPEFFQGLTSSFAFGFILVALVMIPSLIFGQENVLPFFGYGKEVAESSFVSTTPICHRIDHDILTCRASGTFTHPIHFAAYLLFILPVFVISAVKSQGKLRWLYICLVFLNIVFNLFTVSRFSLLGLIVLASSFGVIWIFNKTKLKSLKQKNILAKLAIAVFILVQLFIGLVFINLDPQETSKYLPAFITKPHSTTWHYRHFRSSVDFVLADLNKISTGYGLGTSGSATRDKYQDVEQNYIYLNYAEQAGRWLIPLRQSLLPDNWVLQVLLNGGIIYTLFYFILVFYPLQSLWLFFKSGDVFDRISFFNLLFGSTFLSIFVGNLFLHLWENQTIAVYWTMVWAYRNSISLAR